MVKRPKKTPLDVHRFGAHPKKTSSQVRWLVFWIFVKAALNERKTVGNHIVYVYTHIHICLEIYVYIISNENRWPMRFQVVLSGEDDCCTVILCIYVCLWLTTLHTCLLSIYY